MRYVTTLGLVSFFTDFSTEMVLGVLPLFIVSTLGASRALLGAVFGLFAGVSETVQRTVIPKYVSSELRGTAFGLYNLVVGVCLFASNVLFGFLWDSFSLTVAVSYSAAMSLAAISGMAIFIHKYAKPAKGQRKRT